MADAGEFDHWRGGEQAPLPAQDVDAGTFDYWRGGELLPVHMEATAIDVAANINISPGASYIQVI
jgi:hypothetical protein